MEWTQAGRVMYELVMADKPVAEDAFENERQWPLDELLDMAEYSFNDYAALPFKSGSGWQDKVVWIQTLVNKEIVQRMVQKRRRAENHWTVDDDRYWFGSGDIDSDPYDVDRDGPGF